MSVDYHENRYNCCRRTSHFKTKMHQIRFQLGCRPKPRWGNLQLEEGRKRKGRKLRKEGVKGGEWREGKVCFIGFGGIGVCPLVRGQADVSDCLFRLSLTQNGVHHRHRTCIRGCAYLRPQTLTASPPPPPHGTAALTGRVAGAARDVNIGRRRVHEKRPTRRGPCCR